MDAETFDVLCLLILLLILAALGGIAALFESSKMWKKFQRFILHIFEGEE